MFVTRRSPVKNANIRPASRSSGAGGGGEAALFILSGLGAIGGLAYLFIALDF